MTRKVLVVDDSRLARMMVRNLIEQIWPDSSVSEASQADEALSAVGAEAPDHVIIDQNMPGTDGLDLARTIRDMAPAASLTLVTANIQNSIRERARELGCGFVAKPVNEEKISRLLADLEKG